MDKFIASYHNYSIWQLSENGLMDLAQFVVYENYKHHQMVEKLNNDFQSEIISVYNEEMRYFSRSDTFVEKSKDNDIIGAIRLMNWDRKEALPMHELFDIGSKYDIPLEYENTPIWHIGRLAISNKVGRYGIVLFKLLLVYAISPICKQKKGIILAECDSKLLKTLQIMGMQVKPLGKGAHYLGSETIPVYATYNGVKRFFFNNHSLMCNSQVNTFSDIH